MRLLFYFAAVFALLWLSDVAPVIGIPLGIIFVIVQFVRFKRPAPETIDSERPDDSHHHHQQ